MAGIRTERNERMWTCANSMRAREWAEAKRKRNETEKRTHSRNENVMKSRASAKESNRLVQVGAIFVAFQSNVFSLVPLCGGDTIRELTRATRTRIYNFIFSFFDSTQIQWNILFGVGRKGKKSQKNQSFCFVDREKIVIDTAVIAVFFFSKNFKSILSFQQLLFLCFLCNFFLNFFFSISKRMREQKGNEKID